MSCRRRRGSITLKHRLDTGRAARVVKAADDELAFQPASERLICVAEFCQSSLDGIHRINPAEQCRVRLSDLERDLGSFTWIGRQSQRLLEVNERRFAPCAHLCTGRPP